MLLAHVTTLKSDMIIYTTFLAKSPGNQCVLDLSFSVWSHWMMLGVCVCVFYTLWPWKMRALVIRSFGSVLGDRVGSGEYTGTIELGSWPWYHRFLLFWLRQKILDLPFVIWRETVDCWLYHYKLELNSNTLRYYFSPSFWKHKPQ